MGTAAGESEHETSATRRTEVDVVRILDELRGENSRLKAYVSGLESAAGKDTGWEDDESGERNALALEVAELRARLAEAEQHLETIRQTFIYRIGEAIVSARSWKGLVRLPGRLLRLRRAFVEKRRAFQRGDADGAHFSRRMRYVSETLGIFAEQGLNNAAVFARGLPSGQPKEKARALVELAHIARHDAPQASALLGIDAARLNPREQRLRPLILGLLGQGEVDGPAQLLDVADASLMSSPADQRRCAEIQSQSRRMNSQGAGANAPQPCLERAGSGLNGHGSH